jgi:tetratricopeptide (TPR) repeat protein
MRQSFLAAVAVAAVLAPPLAAQAASLVLGSGLARSCYEYAERGLMDSGSVQTCTKALQEEPLSPRDRASTFVNRGVMQLRRKAYTAAVQDFDRAVGLVGGLGEAYVNRGSAKVGLGQYDDALVDLDRGLKLGAREPEKAWYNKALAYEAKGDPKAAYAAYRKASELRPDWDLPKAQLARFKRRE